MKGKDQSKIDPKRGKSSRTPSIETNAEDSHPLMGLQAQIGNRAVSDLVSDAGSPVPAAIRGPIESSFGRGFSEVRIHEGREVDDVGERIDAPAFAAGEDIFIRSDAPPLDSPMGRLMIGEELAHVAQGVGTKGPLEILPRDHPSESEAQSAAVSAASGEPATVSPAGSTHSAVGRFDPFGLIGGDIAKGLGDLFGEEEKQPALSFNTKNRLMSGAVVPMLTASNQIFAGGEPSSIQGSLGGISQLIMAAQAEAPEELKGQLIDASNTVLTAEASLIAITDPQKVIGSALHHIESTSTGIETMAANAKEPPPIEPGTAAKVPEHLTLSDAAQLRAGAVTPLNWAASQISVQESGTVVSGPEVVISRLETVASFLENFGAPPAFQAGLSKFGRSAKGAAQDLRAATGGEQVARAQAGSQLMAGVAMISALPADEK